MYFNKIKQTFRRLFKTKDKYINSKRKIMENNLLYSEEYLSSIKRKNEAEYIMCMNLNKINKIIIDDFINELNKKFYGK